MKNTEMLEELIALYIFCVLVFAIPVKAQLDNASSSIQTGAVVTVRWNPAGDKVATGWSSGLVTIWDQNLNSLVNLEAHTAEVYALAWIPDGSQLASGGADGKIAIWNIASNTLNRQFENSGYTNIAGRPVFSLAWSPDGTEIAAIGEAGYLRIWELETAALRVNIEATYGFGYGVRWSSDGEFIAIGGNDDFTKVWKSDTLEVISQLEAHPDGSAMDVSWNHDGSYLAAAIFSTRSHYIAVWGVATQTQIVSLEGHSDMIRSIAWNHENNILVSGGFDQNIILWDVENGEALAIIPLSAPVNSLDWQPGTNAIAFSTGAVPIQFMDLTHYIAALPTPSD